MDALKYMIAAGALLAGAAAGCGNTLGPNPEQELFDASVKRWVETGPAVYRMEIGRTCSCPQSATAILVVSNGVVQSRTYSDTGAPVPAAKAGEFPDVLTLFDLVRQARQQKYFAYSAQYDPTYGYPTTVLLDRVGSTLEDNINYQVVALEPVP